ncbi:hypothetical protein SPV_2491 [Streptococcus pneumoniae]|nr:hypothetical protein SPV_2491 [Streptococcus pneumoniae]
MLDASRYLAN